MFHDEKIQDISKHADLVHSVCCKGNIRLKRFQF